MFHPDGLTMSGLQMTVFDLLTGNTLTLDTSLVRRKGGGVRVEDLFHLKFAIALFAGALLWVGVMPDEPMTAMLASAGAAAAADLLQILTSRV